MVDTPNSPRAAGTPWWTPERHADRRPLLLARNRIKAAIRAHLEAQDFVEVEPDCLQVSPGNETHLHAFATAYVAENGARRPLYLHTSPEFAMKKLLAAGERRIFAFAPVFRNGESGRRHAAEFTMLEWYRAEAPYAAVMQDCLDFATLAADQVGTSLWRCGDSLADVGQPALRISVADAFGRFASIDLAATIAGVDVDRDGLARQVSSQGVRVAADDTWSDLFSRVLATRVEPALAAIRTPVILDRYPTHEAALARPLAEDHRYAERFEMYVSGLELANCFGELTDAAEQRRRFEAEMAEKERVYGERYPIDEDFLAALSQMPDASGGAMGFDRLVMLATGAGDIAHVRWTG